MKETKNTRRMQTRNDKITSSKRGVEKAHWKHQGCYVGHENFLFPTIKNIQMFRVECIGYNVNWTIQSSHFLFSTWPFGGVWGSGGFKFLGIFVFVLCSHHVLQVPKTIPQPVPDRSTLLYHNLC
jgi:hypothetical protein